MAFNMAPFSDVHRFKPGKDVESPGSAALVKQALLPAIRLDLLPKASIDVYITVLDMDTSVSGCIALATTAASAALAEAGIEMYGLVTGSTAVRETTDGSPLSLPSRSKAKCTKSGWLIPRSRRRHMPVSISCSAPCQRLDVPLVTHCKDPRMTSKRSRRYVYCAHIRSPTLFLRSTPSCIARRPRRSTKSNRN